MRRRNIKLLVMLLSIAVVSGGCHSNTDIDSPQLLEPMATNDAYRPVEKGDIGNVKVLTGTVVPQKYCSFFETNVSISDIVVEVGDYVKKGDVVAHANMDEAKKLLASLQEQLSHENKIYNLNACISKEKKNQLISEKSEEDISKKIAVCEEDAHYDRLLHQYRVDKLQEEINSVQEIVNDGILRARHHGYVTYVKNISDNLEALPFENIVIVSDTDDMYIEVEKMKINKYMYSDYEEKYIKFAGKKYNVEEITYTQAEILQAKVSDRYPNVRFQCPEKVKMLMGDTCPIYFIKNNMEDVLKIAKDSLYCENEEYYVYVKNGEKQKEKRYISIGRSDDYYVQVTEGLSENELVYYESDTRIPVSNNTYEVKYTDFEIKNRSKTYRLANTFSFHYNCRQEGRITHLSVKEGEKIAVGDLLYVIDIGEGAAALAEVRNQINRENQTYMENIKELNQNIKKISKEKEDASKFELKILQYQKEIVDAEHVYNLKQLQDTYDSINEGNDGYGKVSIYAENSGIVEKVMVAEDDRVVAGEEILSVGIASKEKLLVLLPEEKDFLTYRDNIADVGETVNINDGSKVYTGKCIGWTVNKNNNEEYYIYSEDGNVYISYSTLSGYPDAAFYVEMDDSSFYQSMPKKREVTFSYVLMHDVMAVPKEYVYTQEGKKDEQCNYVWRIVNDELVKQYVLIDWKLSDDENVVILSGMKAGDVIAVE